MNNTKEMTGENGKFHQNNNDKIDILVNYLFDKYNASYGKHTQSKTGCPKTESLTNENTSIGKKYTNATKSIVYTIVSVEDGAAIMDNGTKINLLQLANTNYYTQVHNDATENIPVSSTTESNNELMYNKECPFFVYYYHNNKSQKMVADLKNEYKNIPNMWFVPTEGENRIERI